MSPDTRPPASDCCAPIKNTADAPQGRSGLGFGFGAAGTAIIASACCWLPLALIALGASAAGVGATFERWRPLMLGVTIVLLAVGFWFAYRPQRCAPGSSCATVPPSKRRQLRLTLWAVTVFTAVMAAFPWYAPLLMRPTEPAPQGVEVGANDTTDVHTASYRIDGMTCAACAINLRRSLATLPRVTTAIVDYNQKRATVHWKADVDAAQMGQMVREATNREGYEATAEQE